MSTRSFRIPDIWGFNNNDVRHARFRSSGDHRSLTDSLYLFTAIVFFHGTVGVLYEYMAKCLCLRSTSTTSSTSHTKIKAAICKSEMYSVYFGLLFVISDDFTLRIHSSLHTMGSSSYVPPIYTPHNPSPYVSMNAMYAGSAGITSLHLVISATVSCRSFRITSTDCVTAVYFPGLTMAVLVPVLNLMARISTLPLGSE